MTMAACKDVNEPQVHSMQTPAEEELIEKNQASSEQSKDQMMDKTVWQVLQADGRFNIFLRMATQTNIQQELDGMGPLTLFAPSDDAFENMEATKKSNIESSVTEMRRFLEHHLCRGVLKSEDFKFGPIKMMSGLEAMVVPFSGGAMIDDAVLLESDLQAKNGIIHEIDKPLSPPRS